MRIQQLFTYATLAKGSTFSSVEINGLPDTYDVVYDEQALRVVDTTKEEPDQDKDTDKDTDKETDKDVDNGTETDNGTENEKDTDDVPNVPVESEDDKNKKDNKNHTDVDYPTYEASKQSETSKQINADDSTKKEIDTVKNPKTGDDTNLIPYVVLLVGSVLTAGFVLFRRKLKRVDN
ncbi:LPXTG cell wall anchor domain-containing protein [Metabacillus niabensis]|uniref:LPXTG cell wall anchor domain-containing protein n=1 Tax=Metabacillus niabensis TaxID=324854 RepID=UPI0039A32A04